MYTNMQRDRILRHYIWTDYVNARGHFRLVLGVESIFFYLLRIILASILHVHCIYRAMRQLLN